MGDALALGGRTFADLVAAPEVDVSAGTGAAVVSVPVPLTEARAGLAPMLALAYSSSAENSAYGFGWSLDGIPCISVSTLDRLPRYDGSDRHTAGDGDELVPALEAVDGGWRPRTFDRDAFTVHCFRSKVDRSRTRFEQWIEKVSGRVHWRSRDPADVVTIYGAGPGGESRIGDPAGPERTFAWLPETQIDPRGNAIRFVWVPENGVGIDPSLSFEHDRFARGAGFAQRYLKRLQYGNTRPFAENEAVPPDNRWSFQAVLDYGDHAGEEPDTAKTGDWPARIDPFSTMRPGFEVRTHRLCRRILMFHEFDELGPGPTLVGAMALEYDENPAGTTLTAIRRTGYRRAQDGAVASERSVPPTRFAYSTPVAETAFVAATPAAAENAPDGLAGVRHQWVDLYGDGLPGMLYKADTAWYFKANEGGGAFGPQRLVRERPAEQPGHYALSDFDRDGNPNAVALEGRGAGYYELDRRTGSWDGFRPLPSVPHLEAVGGRAQWLDVDGDGRPELLLPQADRLTWWGARGKEGFAPALDAPVGAAGSGLAAPPIAEDPQLDLFFADMNGDGLADLVQIQNGRVEYWPQIGNGRFGQAVLMEDSPVFGGEYDSSRIRLVDLDGTGTADLIYLANGEVRRFTNALGNRLVEQPPLGPAPYIENLAAVQVLDFLGDGTPCLVWSSPLPGQAESIRYLPLTGGVQPRVLVSVENGMGHEVRLTYSTSAAHYLRDTQSGRGWRSLLPSHSVVVDRREVIDHVGGGRAVSRYEYHDGHFDGDRQRFRGFALVDRYDAEGQPSGAGSDLPLAAPACLRMWFHPGSEEIAVAADAYAEDAQQPAIAPHRIDALGALIPDEYEDALRALAGEPIREELYAVDAGGTRARHPFRVTQHGYRVQRLQPAASDAQASFSVESHEDLELDYEQAPDDPRITHELTLDADAYGNPTLTASAAYPRRPGAQARVPAQDAPSLTVTTQRYVNHDEPGRYELAVGVESQELEIAGLGAGSGAVFDPSSLGAALAPVLAAPLDHQQAFTGGPQARRIGWDRSYYWNDERTDALPLGEVGSPTLPHHAESACFTDAFVREQFGARVDSALLEGEACYVAAEGHWWQAEAQQRFTGPDTFFQLAALLRPDGGLTVYSYDQPAALTPVELRDPLGNRTAAVIDYHLVEPRSVTDPNGSVTEALFDPLGVAVVVARHGDVVAAGGGAEPYGDDALADYALPDGVQHATVLADPQRFLQGAGAFTAYDLDAWGEGRGPVAAATLEREELVHDGRGGGAPTGTVRASVSYLDGFGSSVQSKLVVESGAAIQRDAAGAVVVDDAGRAVLAEAPERWLASGHVLYNEKRQPVQEYEPFYSSSSAFESDDVLQRFGVSSTTVYDAAGREVERHLASGALTRTEFSSWRVRHFDANDTVQDSVYRLTREGLPDSSPEKQALRKAQAHADTPLDVDLDPQSRKVREVETAPAGDRVTSVGLDASGSAVVVTDPRGLDAVVTVYDLRGRAIRSHSVDAGDVTTLPDALDRPAHQWDARGVHQHRRFDVLDRTLSVSVEVAPGEERLLEQTVYGEDGGVAGARLRNALGRAVLQRDQSGTVSVEAYEPTGNILDSRRQLRRDYKAPADWLHPDAVDLEPDQYRSAASFDALGRVRESTGPDGTVRLYDFLRGGGLGRLRLRSTDGTLAEVALLAEAEFNARGQRTRAVLGNGVETASEFDRETFRTSRFSARGAGATPRTLLDLSYTYDPVGNLTSANDASQEPAGGSTPLLQGLTVSPRQDFTFDPFYQLTEATGRVHQALVEQDYRPGLHHPGGLKGTRHLTLDNGAAVERYTQAYDYDAAGNLVRLRHHGPVHSWTTELWTSPMSNRSLSALDPDGNPVADPESRFDAAGNCTFLPHLRALEWNDRSQLTRALMVDRSASGQPDDAEYYVYGSNGRRARKVAERLVNGQVEVTEKIYLEGCELKRIRRNGSVLLERATSDVGDESGRIAIVHRWTVDALGRETDDVARPRFHYQLGNHVGSSVLELDEAGGVISYEEYFPYGMSAFIAGPSLRDVDLKDYRYSGKEHDDATGLYYFEYRYYAPWIGRWVSPDPIGPEDSPNLYQYAFNNPVSFVDPEGTQATPTEPRSGRVFKYEGAVPPPVHEAFRRLPDAQKEVVRRNRYQYQYDVESGRVRFPALGEFESEIRRETASGRNVEVRVPGRPEVIGEGAIDTAAPPGISDPVGAFSGVSEGLQAGGGGGGAPKRGPGKAGEENGKDGSEGTRPGGKPESAPPPAPGGGGSGGAKQGVHAADGSGQSSTAPAPEPDDGGSGAGPLGAGPGAGVAGTAPGGGGSASSAGAGAGQRQGPGRGRGTGEPATRTGLRATGPEGRGVAGGRDVTHLPPSPAGRPLPPGQQVNGSDANGNPDGSRFSSRAGVGAHIGPGRSGGSRLGLAWGSAGGSRLGTGDREQQRAVLDRVTTGVGRLNLESGLDRRTGQSGGVPGGRGKWNLGALGQIAYIGLTAVGLLGLGGVSALVKGVGKGVAAAAKGVATLAKGVARRVVGAARGLAKGATTASRGVTGALRTRPSATTAASRGDITSPGIPLGSGGPPLVSELEVRTLLVRNRELTGAARETFTLLRNKSVRLNFVNHPETKWRGWYTWGEADIYINLAQHTTPLSAAKSVIHEATHFLQNAGAAYHLGHEIEAIARAHIFERALGEGSATTARTLVRRISLLYPDLRLARGWRPNLPQNWGLLLK